MRAKNLWIVCMTHNAMSHNAQGLGFGVWGVGGMSHNAQGFRWNGFTVWGVVKHNAQGFRYNRFTVQGLGCDETQCT